MTIEIRPESPLPGDFPYFPSLARQGLAPTELIAALNDLGPVGVAWERLAQTLMTAGQLPERTRELVILRVAFLLGCEFIWGGHVLIAHDVGLRFPLAYSSGDSTIVQATDQLITSDHLDDTTFTRLREVLSLNQLVELTIVVNLYVSVSMITEARRIGRQVSADSLPHVWPGPIPTPSHGSEHEPGQVLRS